MKLVFAGLRFVAGIASAIAIVATFVASAAANGSVELFDFFGYFTIQGNILCVIVFIVSASVTFSGRRQTTALVFARGLGTSYIVIVGIVYNTLLTGADVGVLVPWANTVLHVVLPLYAAIDWVFFGDRQPLPWRRFAWVLVYPLVWTAVVLVRGATDGWVPYPFLDPSMGYGVVALYCAGIAVAFAAVGALVWAASRLRILKP